MKTRRTAMLLAVVMGLSSVTGCSSEKKKTYEQAEKDLEQGSYEYALQGYAASVENGVNLPESYRGAGIANMRMGNYEDAIVNFTSALNCEKVSKSLRRDLLLYRASAEFKAEQYDSAMLDCQTLSQEFSMDAESYFLTGRVALAMDSYSEAASNFSSAYEKDSTYDRAIQIYEAYLEKDMEADGTRYLENALTTEPKSAQDYCDRGLVYYYMQDYDNARLELIEASKKDSTEALLILGMVYLAQNNISNARAMYQQYISAEGDSAKGYNGLALCDIKEGNYDSALSNISTGISMADTEEMQSLLYNEIVAYEKKSDFATALTKAREYMDMYPDDESVAKEVSFLKTRTDSQ